MFGPLPVAAALGPDGIPAVVVGDLPPLETPAAEPDEEGEDPRGHEDEGNDDIVEELLYESTENATETGGSIEIVRDPSLPPVQVTGCEVSDPNYVCEIRYAGPEYNNPETWRQMGFGAECWKLEPGGYSYVLPATPRPPSGRSGAVYSMVKVKAGSIQSTDPDFRVNTLFHDPSPGSSVWPDSNNDGVYNPGGRNGDKEISHVIVCVNFGSTAAPAPSTSTSLVSESSTSTPTSTSLVPESSTSTAEVPTTASPAPPEPSTPPSSTIPPFERDPEIVIRPAGDRRGPVPPTLEITLRVSVGSDEEIVVLELDLDDFSVEVDEPTLPETGAESDLVRNLAVFVTVVGVLIRLVRRRLLATR